MGTLVISQQRSQHQHHHHSGRRRKATPHFPSPHPTRGYQPFTNCRAFHSSVTMGILPSPPTPPPTRPTRTYSLEPKTPKPQQPHNGKKRSRAIPITPSGSPPTTRPELWAGPAYSNSPPPSSLPIPKFSLHQKRSVSLELPTDDVSVKVLAHAKSAPSTPTAGSGMGFFGGDNDAAIATENLRRILHLDIA